MNSYNILFILPKPPVRIIGGYKVVYDYANYLSKEGFKVSIAYDCSQIGKNLNINSKIIKKLDGVRLLNKANWMSLESNINSKLYVSKRDINENDYDFIILTAVTTIHIYDEIKQNEDKYGYFIQGLEDWYQDINVYETYRMNLFKITVSRWLKEIVESYDETNNLYLCRNGIDLELFKVVNPISERNNYSICFMYHQDKCKGMGTMVNLINRLRKKYSQLHINSFGAFEKPSFLGDSDNYTPYANSKQLLQIYNNSAIFICTSIEEGFGLTGAESMACGCALVTTATNGAKEYANINNSMICDVGDENSLYLAVCKLIDDQEFRKKIVSKALDDIREFDINLSREKFKNTIDFIVNNKEDK